MYIYTDDDLTKINRDFLGPKGRRLPWIASYRTYGVVLAVVVGLFAVFLFVGVPLNQWTGLLYCFIVFLLSTYIVRRLNGDVSIVAMLVAGWQEVTVPRAHRPQPKDHLIQARIQRFDYDALPAPRWWEWKARRAARAQGPAVRPAPEKQGSAPINAPQLDASGTDVPMTRRASKQLAATRKA